MPFLLCPASRFHCPGAALNWKFLVCKTRKSSPYLHCSCIVGITGEKYTAFSCCGSYINVKLLFHPRAGLFQSSARSIFINTARDEESLVIFPWLVHIPVHGDLRVPRTQSLPWALEAGIPLPFCNGVNEATPAPALPLPLVRAKGGWRPLGLLGKDLSWANDLLGAVRGSQASSK